MVTHNVGTWTVEEDTKLTNVAMELGKDWAGCSCGDGSEPNEYTVSYNNIKKRKWTVEDDAMLTELVKELGNDWVHIVALFLGQTNGLLHCFRVE
jgi:hypothetical protein